MNIGSLRHRINLQYPTDYTDEFGSPVRNWTTYLTIWAQVTLSSTGEQLNGSQLAAFGSYAILCRYTPDLKTNHRILWGDKILNIMGPPRDLDGTRVALLISVTESVEAMAGAP